jgi:hypothetical protein
MPMKPSDEDKCLLFAGQDEFGYCYTKPSTILFAFARYPQITMVAFYEGLEKIIVDRNRYLDQYAKKIFNRNIDDELHIETYIKMEFTKDMISMLGEGWRQALSLVSEGNVYIQKAVDCDVHNEEERIFLVGKIKEIARNLA